MRGFRALYLLPFVQPLPSGWLSCAYTYLTGCPCCKPLFWVIILLTVQTLYIRLADPKFCCLRLLYSLTGISQKYNPLPCSAKFCTHNVHIELVEMNFPAGTAYHQEPQTERQMVENFHNPYFVHRRKKKSVTKNTEEMKRRRLAPRWMLAAQCMHSLQDSAGARVQQLAAELSLVLLLLLLLVVFRKCGFFLCGYWRWKPDC